MAFEFFDELSGSPQVKFLSNGNGTATRQGKVAWDLLEWADPAPPAESNTVEDSTE